MKHLTCALVMLLCTGATLAAKDPADIMATTVLTKAGIQATVCEMPRVGDGTLAAALARAGVAQVHALAADAKAADAARKPAAASGLLGSQVIIETGNSDALPLGEWVADLYLVTDATDANLKTLPATEMARVLSPYRGTAVVGNPGGGKSGLSKSALSEWARGAGGTATIDEDVTGLWMVVKMPPLAGGDDWTHYAHGPDQNRYSKDDALRWPYLLQWASKPYYDGKFDMAVAAGGRLFRANATLAVGGTTTDGITARSAYNGGVLWKRKTADDFGTFGSLIVATAEVVYLKDGSGVLCLDAETGTERKRFSLSDDPQTECKWLALQDGVLVTVIGRRPKQKSLRGLPNELTAANGDTENWGNTPRNFGIHQQWFQDYDRGTKLIALDATSGQELWRYSEAGIDPAKTAIAARRVFCYADRADAVCLDLTTGKTIWKTAATIVRDPRGTGWSFTFLITVRVGAP